eukprot:SAG11_NODE_20279_length_449_cov_0.720000_1_plen_99_part_00
MLARQLQRDGGGGGGEAEADEPICRICFDGDAEQLAAGLLLSPCLCRGSMRYVHQECLNQWRTSSQNPDSLSACDSCRFLYRVRPPARPRGHAWRGAV